MYDAQTSIKKWIYLCNYYKTHNVWNCWDGNKIYNTTWRIEQKDAKRFQWHRKLGKSTSENFSCEKKKEKEERLGFLDYSCNSLMLAVNLKTTPADEK